MNTFRLLTLNILLLVIFSTTESLCALRCAAVRASTRKALPAATPRVALARAVAGRQTNAMSKRTLCGPNYWGRYCRPCDAVCGMIGGVAGALVGGTVVGGGSKIIATAYDEKAAHAISDNGLYLGLLSGGATGAALAGGPVGLVGWGTACITLKALHEAKV